MSNRASKRTPVPSHKALEAARDTQRTRETERTKNRTGFRQFGSQHAAELASGGGLEVLDVESDDDGEETEVTLLSGQGDKRTEPQPKLKKARVSKKWTPWINLALANAGLKHEVWNVAGSDLSVAEKWATCHKTLNEEPFVRVFKDKKESAIQSHFDALVLAQSKKNGRALRESGGGTAEDTLGTDEERVLNADLEKTLTAIVDAKAAAKAESVETKEKKAAEAANSTLMGSLSIAQGNKRCGPGARATPFEEALAEDDLALKAGRQAAGLVISKQATSRESGRSSPTTSIGGTSSGRTSPASSVSGLRSGRSSPIAGAMKRVPPLGTDLAKELGAPSAMALARRTGFRPEEADHFLTGGFTYDELEHQKAVSMMSLLISSTLKAKRDGQSVEAYMDGVDDPDCCEVPGLCGLLVNQVCRHYGVDAGAFVQSDDGWAFVNGWIFDNKPTTAKFDIQTKRLAMLLMPCPSSVDLTKPTSSTSATSSIGGLGPESKSIEGSSQEGIGIEGVASNRGRKPRSSKNKLEEDGLDGFMERQMLKAEEMANRKREEDGKKEAASRQWMMDQLTHDRELRQQERDHERNMRAEERKEEGRQAAADRAHQLQVLQLQLQLARANNQNN